MSRLLKIEFQKILSNKTVWVILGLYVLLLAPTAFGFENIIKSVHFTSTHNGKQEPTLAGFLLQGYSIFSFPGVWQNLAYLASWFKLLLAILVVILVTNEYSYKTLRQNIIDGMSKWEVVWAKQLVILIICIAATVFLLLLTLLLGKSHPGTATFTGSGIMSAYFFSLLLYLNFAWLLSSWLKKQDLFWVYYFCTH